MKWKIHISTQKRTTISYNVSLMREPLFTFQHVFFHICMLNIFFKLHRFFFKVEIQSKVLALLSLHKNIVHHIQFTIQVFILIAYIFFFFLVWGLLVCYTYSFLFKNLILSRFNVLKLQIKGISTP